MTAQTATLADFLLARIEEDERSVDVPDWHCTDSARGEGWGSRGDECPICGRYMFDGTESATEDAWEMHMADAHGRVLAECEAKRKIVEAWPDTFGLWSADQADAARAMKDVALRALAMPYADHPDWREEWRA
jgi:phage-related protein